MRASWIAVPAGSVAVTRTTFFPSRNLSGNLNRITFLESPFASSFATSWPLMLTLTRATPLPLAALPSAMTSSNAPTRAWSFGSWSVIASGAVSPGSTATTSNWCAQKFGLSALTNWRTSGAYQRRNSNFEGPAPKPVTP